MNNIDNERTKDIACPYCGALCIDSIDDEIIGGEVEYCPECNGEFRIERHIKLTYSTAKSLCDSEKYNRMSKAKGEVTMTNKSNMKTSVKLSTDIAINEAVLNTIHHENVGDLLYIIEEFTSKAKEYAREVEDDNITIKGMEATNE